mmetsp:Transcript_92168/g.265966  ORF Transcript_92168/g.265966 Transcript_92168/m.265966 type:complete len:222 (+) Transcript_92168:1155-1820(+)
MQYGSILPTSSVLMRPDAPWTTPERKAILSLAASLPSLGRPPLSASLCNWYGTGKMHLSQSTHAMTASTSSSSATSLGSFKTRRRGIGSLTHCVRTSTKSILLPSHALERAPRNASSTRDTIPLCASPWTRPLPSATTSSFCLPSDTKEAKEENMVLPSTSSALDRLRGLPPWSRKLSKSCDPLCSSSLLLLLLPSEANAISGTMALPKWFPMEVISLSGS